MSHAPIRIARLPASLLALGLLTLGSTAAMATPASPVVSATKDESLVSCRLPAQVRRLGGKVIFLAPRVTVHTSPSDCDIRGGESVALTFE